MRLGAAVLLMAIALAWSAPARSAERSPLFLPSDREGSLFAPDRELHFAGSLAISASLRVEGRPRGTAFGITIGAGMLKEAYDAFWKPGRPGRGASRKDLLADLAGAALGILIVEAVDR